MRQVYIVLLSSMLLLSSCGSLSSAQPASQGTAPAAAAPTTSVPTAPPPASPTSAPTATTAVPSATATSAPTATPEPTAEPTEELFLPAATHTAVPSVEASATAEASTPTAANTTTNTAAPSSSRAASSEPIRLRIPDIKLDGKLVSVGLDANRIPIVPDHDIGWYNLSAKPGEGENIVLWGHVLRFRHAPDIPAPFANIKTLQPGAEVVLYDADGGEHRYVVTQQIWVKPNQVEYILPRGKEMVTMVSCIGDKVISNGEVIDMTNRLITIAEPVG
jgi:sortase (surface protein transpeptidase)